MLGRLHQQPTGLSDPHAQLLQTSNRD